jgi:excisionase family DNA binding protein
MSDMLTVDEAAARLRVNRKTLYAAIAEGEIPGVIRFGRVLRIHWPSFVELSRETKGKSRERPLQGVVG